MLKPRKRITKRQLKEDKLVTFYQNAQTWIEEYSKYVIGGVAAVIIIVVVVMMYNSSQQAAEKEASVKLSQATKSYERGDYQTATSLLSNLVEENGGTRSGKMGHLYLANSLFQTQDYAGAEENYKKFISGFKGDEHILSSAAAGVAACYEEKNEFEVAAKEYENVVKKYADSIFAPRYLMRAARCYELATNKDKAKEVYAKVIEEFPDSEEKGDAVVLSAML
jgi:TolA-binding protein